jgi:hypothetical protein
MTFSCLTNCCFVEAFALVKKLSHILCISFQQMILVEIFDTWEKQNGKGEIYYSVIPSVIL